MAAIPPQLTVRGVEYAVEATDSFQVGRLVTKKQHDGEPDGEHHGCFAKAGNRFSLMHAFDELEYAKDDPGTGLAIGAPVAIVGADGNDATGRRRRSAMATGRRRATIRRGSRRCSRCSRCGRRSSGSGEGATGARCGARRPSLGPPRSPPRSRRADHIVSDTSPRKAPSPAPPATTAPSPMSTSPRVIFHSSRSASGFFCSLLRST